MAEVCTIYSSPSLPVGVLGPTLERLLLTKDNLEILAIIYTNLSCSMFSLVPYIRIISVASEKNVGSKSRLKQ